MHAGQTSNSGGAFLCSCCCKIKSVGPHRLNTGGLLEAREYLLGGGGDYMTKKQIVPVGSSS